MPQTGPLDFKDRSSDPTAPAASITKLFGKAAGLFTRRNGEAAKRLLTDADIDHDHDGSPTQKLAQANTHESADTDSGTTALHHTLGGGANQAAAGNHAHSLSGSVQFKSKTADESVTSSTTLQTDNHLTGFVLETSSTYEVELMLRYDGAQGGDLQFQLATAGGAAPGVVGLVIALHQGATGANETRAIPVLGNVTIGVLTGSEAAALAKFRLLSSTHTDVELRWAQGSSHATATRLLSGSYMKLTKVA